jgi:hypothetical protein
MRAGMPIRNRCHRVVQRVRSWPRYVLIGVATVILLLVAARIALPFTIKQKVNERLADIPGYSGRVDGVGVSLLRGAYSLYGIGIFKEEGEAREPFFAADYIDFSVAWRELFRRKVVSDILVEGAELNVVKAATDETSQKDIDRRWQDVIKDLFPIDITHLELKNGFVRYQDRTKEPHVDVFVKNMHVLATGLRNRPGETEGEFPAQISVAGDSLGGGKLNLVLEADPLAPHPHFEARLKIDDVDLAALNDSLRAVANVDVSRGTFRMAGEMAGKDGGFQGYVKPFFEDLDFNNIEDKEKGVFSRLWENVVQGLAWLVKNKSRDQVATRIPFQGRFGDPKVGLLATVTNLFRHGFIRAFNPTVEGSVQAENVLPTGESADGRSVADVKNDDPGKAGAPTGRTAQPRPRD